MEDRIFNINPLNKKIFVVDDFYTDPYKIREFALNQEYYRDLNYFKGQRSRNRYLDDNIKLKFEEIIGQKITVWEEHPMNGVFNVCSAEENLVYHCDSQTFAGIIYLNIDPPYESGTSLLANKRTGARHVDQITNFEECFSGGFYDKTKFDLVDNIGNVFNRLVIFDSKSIHSAAAYFGQNLDDSRLTHLFFFD
jgi:hypothetical protein